MPMQTFFNLPEDKKQTILKAAGQEFSRVPLEHASIANIIKTANIPRGSFYQYFYDKEDLYIFMIHSLGEKLSDKTLGYLKENNGDIIEVFIKVFYELIDFMNEDEYSGFFKNIFLNMNDKTRDSLTPNGGGHRCGHSHMEHGHLNYLDNVLKNMDISKLAVKNEKEVLYVLKMIKGLLFQNLVPYFSGKISEEEAIESYLFQMNLIKKAIYK